MTADRARRTLLGIDEQKYIKGLEAAIWTEYVKTPSRAEFAFLGLVPAAPNAHISVIGHITATELRHHINPVELANGLLNRFLLLGCRRVRLLPEGGAPEPLAALDRELGRQRRRAGENPPQRREVVVVDDRMLGQRDDHRRRDERASRRRW